MSAQDVLVAHSVGAMGSHRLGCMCGWDSGHHRYADAIAEHAAHQVAALTADGFAIVKVDDYNRDLAAVAEWQRTALIVITAANNFITDCVTGDGDPRTIAKALIDSGFDGRTER